MKLSSKNHEKVPALEVREMAEAAAAAAEQEREEERLRQEQARVAAGEALQRRLEAATSKKQLRKVPGV